MAVKPDTAEDGHLLPLAFEAGLGSQDLLGEMAGRVGVG
jgi:hypothetical protein